eukprot:CAMPEP_0174938558 /NCGR_PEP_ID=MMETSP1355-20121228/63832_1 /TAXON_ID=464990 /ORGANISM="Hemiselmis tepida, Strain CCMP443" /LENGTH=54 /DNA_ID=CAMNT_0016185491 /DNA_START=35 /DNA_END=196 /DNA_ORIENTATION=-
MSSLSMSSSRMIFLPMPRVLSIVLAMLLIVTEAELLSLFLSAGFTGSPVMGHSV